MVYPLGGAVSPLRGRFDDNPFEKFRIQRSDRGGILGSNTATGYRSRKRHSRIRFLRYALLLIAVLGLLYYLWSRQGSVSQQSGEQQNSDGFSDTDTNVEPVKDSRAQIGKEKATLVMLVRNRELKDAIASIKQVEDRFNRHYHYPWTFLNDEPFTDEFKESTTKRASGKTQYGIIPSSQWSVPDHIDKSKMEKAIDAMSAKNIIYGDSVPYRHMCRYNSGFFWRHELLDKYDWYWRVEPGIGFFCDQEYDPFTFMRENGKKYGFVISLPEYRETIETLWSSTKEFMKANPQYLAPKNSLGFIVDNDKGLDGDYNNCHFWSNFEIGSLNFWRSEAYIKYFEFLDRKGGFYYERWGDAPVHSIAVALFLNSDEVHWFNDIGYYHQPFGRCPYADEDSINSGRCICPIKKKDNFDADGYSCTPKWWRLRGLDPKTGDKKKE
ncbi:nucleotide-diphospho-sugar transferase [Kalaharituber pfeilii]|nr:nucleotide-diphospho-sugar transferase [Kalaharituber pfeilii]